jgi:microsomal dipeptidase-like Zn-dependent dipeptidase
MADHFYTTSAKERDQAVSSFGYTDEGIACYVFGAKQPKTRALYRLYNPGNGDHFYTISAKERDQAVSSVGYTDEGIACYVFGAKQPKARGLHRLWKSGEPPRPLVHVNPQGVRLGGDYWQAGYDIEAGENPPVWGFADLHAHPLAHLGFGGRLLWGEPDGPIDRALAWCDTLHGPGGTGLFVGRDLLSAGMIAFIEGQPGHLVGGYPEFDGWPRFTTLVHQKMHIDWVRRAFEGGLRLMVAHVVNNALLAAASGGSNFDDRTAVETQIQATRALVGRHSDFMEIAYSPADARRIIGAGKLAVVLGVEVDSLGNWGREADTSDNDVRAYLKHLYNDLGIRHIFPIHLANNAFGGTAVYEDLFNFLNAYLRGEFLEVRVTDVDFELADIAVPANAPVAFAGAKVKTYPHGPGGHGNVAGLTDRGLTAVRETMRLGMIVDVDHMSELAVDQTLALAETGGYPVVVGHSAFRDIARSGDRNEYQRTGNHLNRIASLGGMVAVGLFQHDVADGAPRVANDAPGTAKSWAQAYAYAVRLMHPRGVGIGTDINGLSGHAGPRFGMNACHGIKKEDGESPTRKSTRRAFVYSQSNGVRYNSAIRDYRAHRWEGVLQEDVFNGDEQDAWESIAIFRSGTDPNHADMPGPLARNPWRSGKIRNIAKGMRASSESQLENPLFGGNTFNEQKAGYLVARGLTPAPGDAAEIKRLHAITSRIWERWQAMEGSNAPLVRSLAGRRDFDVNIDGVAHYGLLPDFIQDLRNVGLTQQDLCPLFRSAEEYIRMWELCEQKRSRF